MIAGASEDLRAYVGRCLERGPAPNIFFRMAESLWARAASYSLQQKFAAAAKQSQSGPAFISIGGAVLGGAGKTPLAIELARTFAKQMGKRTVLISHAYRAPLKRANIVQWNDNPDEMGDDALFSAQSLHRDGVPVIAAPSKSAAFQLACSLSPDIVVSDGLFIPPAPFRCETVLALDALAPFGAGYCPPLGDLRAPPSVLLACFDHCVLLRDPCVPAPIAPPILKSPVWAEYQITGASNTQGLYFNIDELKSYRIGLILGIAHPERIIKSLHCRGLYSDPILLFGDHARFSKTINPGKAPAPQLWLSSGRCAPKLPARISGAPVLALGHQIDAQPVAERLAQAMTSPR